MKVLFSFSFAVRLGFWMLLAGFAAGLLTGYQATAATATELPVDPRSIGAVHCLDRSGPPCTPTSFSS
ncbi:hypothetical protein GCM10010171_60190 [Actinokineospora fastidiosa]|uniref:Uncharacterized protein n=1 Tax=Actinokineospora fastidiosa TaxID=1816 RepID=A0A918GS17_9PSEU|nr:hypothetical protein Actkin_05314 [Actinokineospora sp. UTMC 2448]GGS57214.1 hypothetical protein GCM10010171_60190 [Actinokineospora fastidiosa]